MRSLIASAALLASVVAFIAALAIGLFLAGVGESGARGAGLLLVASAVVAFASTLLLVFAPRRLFAGKGRALAFLLGLLAILPLVSISGVALNFAGNPLGSTSPTLDWTAFAVGVLLAVGALATAALAISPGRAGRTAAPAVATTQEGRAGPANLAHPGGDDEEEEVRVISSG